MSRRRAPRGRGGGGKAAAKIEMTWLSHVEIDRKKAVTILGDLSAETIEQAGRESRKGSGRAQPPLSPAYAARKASEGAAPLPNLRRSGSLWSLFRVIKIDVSSAVLGFALRSADDIKKWRRLVKQGRNPLSLSKARMRKIAEKMVRGGVLREVPGGVQTRSRERAGRGGGSTREWDQKRVG